MIKVGAIPLMFSCLKGLSDAAELVEDEEIVLEPVADLSEYGDEDPYGEEVEPPRVLDTP